jgi:hypothetical protein
MFLLGDCPSDQYPRAQELMDYVTETWIDGATAVFQIPVWNKFGTNGPRTTNHLEGWHRKLNDRAGHAHPNIYKIIDVFKVS